MKPTIQIKITNQTDTAQSYNLFGYNFNYTNQNPALHISATGATFASLQRASSNTNWLINVIKLRASSTQQAEQPINIYTEQITGYKTSYTIFPDDYTGPQYRANTLISIKPVKIPITANTGISGIIMPNQSLTIIFNLQQIQTGIKYRNAIANNKNMFFRIKNGKNILLACNIETD